ncbi:MAG TPA: PspA/IM30 family protein, partial [Polyangia bacterium]
RMAQKVDQIEAEADASVELGNEMTGDTLHQKFKALEAGTVGTDTALSELKAKMGLAPMPESKGALPAQTPIVEDEAKLPSMATPETRSK